MVSPETSVPLAPEELAELLGAEAAQAFAPAKPKRGRPRKGAAAADPAPGGSPQWLPLADLAGSVLSVRRPGKSELQGRLAQRDGAWGLWVE
jgi:hypothetical protein